MNKLFAVLVTYRRPAELARTLENLSGQTRRPDLLIVVDNGPTDETKDIVERAAEGSSGAVEYMPMTENLGFTGGVAAAMGHVLEQADDRDWIVICDDDDPPNSTDAFAALMRFAEDMIVREPSTAGVGLGGARFDFRRGRTVRVPTKELKGPVALDYIGGGYFGCYRVAAIRDVGPWSPEIFFGFSEGEFGLRLKRRGYTLWGLGEVWRERRVAAGRGSYDFRPSPRLSQVGWRRYYSLRNVIWILRHHGHARAAMRVTIVNGLGKPLANFPIAPRLALGHLRLNAKAIRDGWTDRMGRRVEPIPWGPRPDERTGSRGSGARRGGPSVAYQTEE